MSKTAHIIGGGIGGLSLGWQLQQRGHTVSLYDAGDHWGGVTESVQEHDCLLELGPDSIIRTKPAAVELIRQLGLEGQIQDTVPENRQALIARGKRLVAVPPGLYLMAPGRIWPFVTSPIVSMFGKMRMLMDLILPRGKQDQDESLADFVRRRLGKEALQRIAQPMVGGIYTADPEQLSLRACMPQFLEMEREHRSLIKAMMKRGKAQQNSAQSSGPRYGLFLSLEGGLQQLAHALVSHFNAGQLHLQARVTSIEKSADGWTCHYDDGSQSSSELLCLCGPAHIHAHLLTKACPALSEALAEIEYADVATINLGFPREQMPALPAASGFVVPAVEQRNLIACTYSSNKYAGRSPEDTVVLRAFAGGALQAHQLDKDDETLLQDVLSDLRELCGINCAPHFHKITRYHKAMAQPHIGHLGRVARIRELCAMEHGLYVTGNGYEGVGIPDIIQQGMSIAEQLSNNN